MKKLLTYLSLIFCLIPNFAAAEFDHIGLFADPAGEQCYFQLEAGVPDSIYVLAILPNLGGSGITAAEFAISRLPLNGDFELGVWEVHWNADLIIGDPEMGITLAFNEVQVGAVVELGRIVFIPVDENWVEMDQVLSIIRTTDSDVIKVVDHIFSEHLVPGNELILNSSDPGSVNCEIFTCSAAPVYLDFGAIPGGQYSLHDFSLVNYGLETISGEISSDDENFIFDSGDGVFTLDPGEIWEGRARYQPLAIGHHEGVIETGNDLCQDILCVGETTEICELIPPSPLEFGEVPLGEYLEMSFQIWNSTTHGPLLTGYVSLGCGDFTVIGGGGFYLRSGEYETITIRFAPSETGGQSCDVWFGHQFCSEMLLTGIGVENPGSHVETEHVGIFLTNSGAGCAANLWSDQLLKLPIVAVLPDPLPGGVSEVEFVVAGIPAGGEAAGGESVLHFPEGAEMEWDHDRIHLSFAEPQFGRFVMLGELHLQQSDESWVGDDHLLSIAGPPIITDGEGGIHQLPGGAMTLNCAEPANCPCGNFEVPVCVVDTSLIAFGSVPVGESAESSFSVANIGGGVIEGQVAIDCDEFSIIGGAEPYQLATGESHLVTVRYEPADAGDYQCEIDIDLCAGVLLTGSSDYLPVCDIEPTEIDFGGVVVGCGEEISFTITNTGGYTLQGSVALTGDDFTLIQGDGDFNLGGGQSRTVVVNFAPSAMQHYVGEIGFGNESCLENLPVSGNGHPLGATGEQIGLFADAAGTICTTETVPGEIDTLFVIAKLLYFSELGLAGARFRIIVLPDQGGGGTWIAEWNSDTVTGSLDSGIELGFDVTQWGEMVELGRLIFTPQVPNWPGVDHQIRVLGGDGEVNPALIDPDGVEWDLIGGSFTWNCTDQSGCPCRDYVSPICRLDHDQLDFGSINYLHNRLKYLRIYNDGQGVLEGDLDLDDENFYISAGGDPFVLGPGDEHQATVFFDPSWTGEFSATLFTGLPGCPEVQLIGEARIEQQSDCLITMYASFDPDTCQAEGQGLVEIEFYALLGEYYLYEGFRGAEFRVENWPQGSGFGAVVEEWLVDQVSGNLGDGINLQFDYPFWSGETYVHLGTAYLAIIDPDYFGDDYRMSVVEHPGSGMLRAWMGYDQAYPARGGGFTFNCTDIESCGCSQFDPGTPVAVNLFDLLASPGQVTARWVADLSGEVKFRLEARLGDAIWHPLFTATAPGHYRAEDNAAALATGGEVVYSLFARDQGDDWLLLREASVVVPPAPIETALLPGYPNPFNPQVTLPFSLAEPQELRLVVYDVAGRRVTTVVEGLFPAGVHEPVWDGYDAGGHEATSGVYFARLELRGEVQTQKLVLLR